MIKFAVTRPKQRIDAITFGTGMLKWNEDPYLKHYGVKIDPEMTTTQARLITPPEVQYTGSTAKPGTTGRWDLRGKKFLKPNVEPLKSWGFCIIQGAVSRADCQNFIQVFMKTYIDHGGRIENKTPFIYEQPRGESEGDAALHARNAVGQQGKLDSSVA